VESGRRSEFSIHANSGQSCFTASTIATPPLRSRHPCIRPPLYYAALKMSVTFVTPGSGQPPKRYPSC
jgi:hypothetical protein